MLKRLSPALAILACCAACSTSTSASETPVTPISSPSTNATSVATVTVTASPTATPSAASSATPAVATADAASSVRRGSDPVRLDVTIRDEGEIEPLLARTSASFRNTIRQELRKESGECDAGQYQIDVSWYWADDQAIGDVGGCGGAMRLWFRPSGGGWNHFDTQDAFACRTLHSMGVPEAMSAKVGGTCYDSPNSSTHSYDPNATPTSQSTEGQCPTPTKYQDGSYMTVLCPDGSPARALESELTKAAPEVMQLNQAASVDDVQQAACDSLASSNGIWVRSAYEYVRAREEWGSPYPTVDQLAESLTDGTCDAQ